MTPNMEIYLRATRYIDADHPDIKAFTEKHEGKGSELQRAVNLYYAVRDLIRYNPYLFNVDPSHYTASFTLQKKEGFCIQKALLLAAVTRAAGIPARVGFANVRNHLTTEKLRKVLQGDLFVFHGYDEIYLEGKWIKATPAFDIDLCERFNVLPLEFDGKHDSVFHPFDGDGRQHMEYVHDYGTFDDFPYDLMIQEVKKYYSHLFKDFERGKNIEGDFRNEA